MDRQRLRPAPSGGSGDHQRGAADGRGSDGHLTNAALIGVASPLVRFGPINLGTAHLTVQIILIGRIAGLNTSAYPMPSVVHGLVQFLRVGLWGGTAYVIVAAVTMTKARWIADRPGAAHNDARSSPDPRAVLRAKDRITVGLVVLPTE